MNQATKAIRDMDTTYLCHTIFFIVSFFGMATPASGTTPHFYDSPINNRDYAQVTNSLMVQSLHGSPTPATGTTWHTQGALINATVDEFVLDYSLCTQHVCVGWSGTGSVPLLGASNSVSFNITNNSTLSWNWITEYYLTINPDLNGDISQMDGWYVALTNLSIAAAASYGYEFVGWIGDIFTNANPLKLTMDRAYNLTPVFAQITNSLMVQSLHGSPTPATGTAWHTQGALINANVDEFVLDYSLCTQHVCVGWSGTGSVPLLGASNSVSFNITNNSALSWNWITEYYLAINPDRHGDVSHMDGWYPQLTDLVITATPHSGYHFTGWTGDVPQGNVNDNPLTLAMNQARSVTVNFAVDIGSVSVTIAPEQAVAAGAQWRMTSGPDTTWHNSGEVVMNVPGDCVPYAVQFSPVHGWIEPVDITDVGIIHGSTIVRNATYLIGDSPQITGCMFQTGIGFSVKWASVAGKLYMIERASSLTGGFQPVAQDIPSTVPENTYTDPPTGEAQSFYRVKVQP